VAEGDRLPGVYVGPSPSDVIVAAVREGGANVVSEIGNAEGVVWLSKDVGSLLLALHRGVRWVQLPDAGVDAWVDAGVLDGPWTVACARGCYGPQVAEHALALLLASTRRLAEAAKAAKWPVDRSWGFTLCGSTVAVVGAGDVGGALIKMLVPLGAHVLAVTRRGHPVPGAKFTLPSSQMREALRSAQVVVVAAPATKDTHYLISGPEFAAMPRGGVLVNVARGSLVDPMALVAALESGQLSAAALDVTEPEPLPEGHPLWLHPSVLITPHVANPPAAKERSLALRVRENTRRFVQHEELLAIVDPVLGY
jgi:phosphoglycerate dehydrogenase-like enzyme